MLKTNGQIESEEGFVPNLNDFLPQVPDKNWKCLECNQLFYVKLSCQNHIEAEHLNGEEGHVCPICSQKVRQYRSKKSMHFYKKDFLKITVKSSVSDPGHFYTDPDPTKIKIRTWIRRGRNTRIRPDPDPSDNKIFF